jgi:short-subunit dehydrogenase
MHLDSTQIVIEGGSGADRAVAAGALGRGANVVIVGRSKEKLEDAQNALEGTDPIADCINE